MTEWLLAQLFDRVRTAMGVRNCADGCHLLQVLVACRLCHICYDLAQRVDVGFRFCLGSRQELLSHAYNDAHRSMAQYLSFAKGWLQIGQAVALRPYPIPSKIRRLLQIWWMAPTVSV